MPRALITGIGGQDGYYLAELLLAEGYEVFGLVRPPLGSIELPDVFLLHGDMRDYTSLERALDAAAPDEVYNLAAVSSLEEARQDPETCSDVNSGGPRRLIRALDALGASSSVRLLQASSPQIFGPADGVPRDEATPLAPSEPYGIAKAEAHRLIEEARSSGLFAVSVILYNHESPRRPLRFVSRRVSRSVAQVVRGKRDKLVVRNLTDVRDWGFAGDYVRAMWMSLRMAQPADYIVATGVSRSVADLVRTAFESVGIGDWEKRVTEEAPGPPSPWSPADPSRARKVLGWSPVVSFSEMIAAMVQCDLETV